MVIVNDVLEDGGRNIICFNDNGLADQHLCSYEEIKNWIDTWIASKDEQFFRRGIRTLPERWEKVMASDEYFES